MNTISFQELAEVNPRVDLQRGKTYPFVEMGIVQPGFRYVRSSQIRDFKGGGAKFINGDTLFARITPCLENGKIAQYINNHDKKGFGSTEFFVFRARPDMSDPGFIYYLSRSDIVRKPAEKSMTGASGRQRADLASIVNISIPHFPLPTQRKIAAILSAYDDLIENNLRRIKILEEMAQNLYREWFVKFRFPGHEKARFVDSEMGRIPEGWEILTVDDIYQKPKRSEQIKKTEYLSSGSIPVIDQGKDFVGGWTENTKALVREFPVIVFGDHTRVLKYVDFPFAKGADGTQLMLSKCDKMPLVLFFYALKNINLSDYAYARHFKFLKQQKITIPLKTHVDAFHAIVFPIRQKIRLLMNKNNGLQLTRDLLLPRLISGEVDVSELDINIPNENET